MFKADDHERLEMLAEYLDKETARAGVRNNPVSPDLRRMSKALKRSQRRWQFWKGVVVGVLLVIGSYAAWDNLRMKPIHVAGDGVIYVRGWKWNFRHWSEKLGN